MTRVLIREEERHRGAGHVKMEAETGVMKLQVKGHQSLTATTRNEEESMEQILTWILEREHNRADILILDFCPSEL